MNFLFKILLSFLLCFSMFFAANAQTGFVVVVNGGVYGTTNYANIGIQNIANNTYFHIDTIYQTSVQDLLVTEQTDFAYVAATDSIIKYNLVTSSRVASTKFGGESTVHLALYGNKLLVGNWYKPWGHTGAYTNYFRIFDANTLSYIDSIPEITKPAIDFVVVGDYAYIAQNNTVASGWGDTLGYLAVVDLVNMAWVRNDTLSGNGEEIGRLIVEDSIIYSLNGNSNTISSYNIVTGMRATVGVNIDLKPKSYANTASTDGQGIWFFPFDSGIGSYDLYNNVVINPNIITISGSYAFNYSPVDSLFFVSHIDFVNQANNSGVIYDMQGDSVNNFQVGYSPEVIGFYNPIITATQHLTTSQGLDCQLYPNPAKEHLNIQLEKAEKVQIVVFNPLGKIVKTQTNNSATIQVDLQNLTAGVYFLHLRNSKGLTTTKRFVKQ